MYTLDRDTLQAARSMADRHGAPVLIHLAETADELKTSQKAHKMSPTRYLESLGFWGPRTLAAHAVWMDDDDVRILASRKVGVSHNPESNMKLASGTARVPAMRAAGIPVGLGTDGAASNNDLDMFEAMRQAALLHKLTTGDPRAVPATVALAMATIEGARALQMQDQIGSLEPGKRADVVSVDATGPAWTPHADDPTLALVWASDGRAVSDVVASGRVVVRDGLCTTVDLVALAAESHDVHHSLISRCGAHPRDE
jgi:5-methylthioadenosine/S-adenosylhomocysteine deaminase